MEYIQEAEATCSQLTMKSFNPKEAQMPAATRDAIFSNGMVSTGTPAERTRGGMRTGSFTYHKFRSENTGIDLRGFPLVCAFKSSSASVT